MIQKFDIQKKFANIFHTPYICRMDRKLTQAEALEDFLLFMKKQPGWKFISRYEKQCIYKARNAAKNGKAGALRLERMFEKFAPGRYRLEALYSLNE